MEERDKKKENERQKIMENNFPKSSNLGNDQFSLEVEDNVLGDLDSQDSCSVDSNDNYKLLLEHK